MVDGTEVDTKAVLLIAYSKKLFASFLFLRIQHLLVEYLNTVVYKTPKQL